MDLLLQNKVAFVAGASSGLGRAVALRLAEEGCQVAMCSRSQERIDRAADAIREEAGADEADVHPLVCDVTDEHSIKAAIDATVERFGKLNVLVTNAGGPPSGKIEEFSADDWRRALELNLMSTINLCAAGRPHLEEAASTDGHARIIMVSSVSAKQPLASLPLSNTSRAGVQGFAKSLSRELGASGITVNTVLPGYTKTDRLNELSAKIQEEENIDAEEVEARWAEQNAVKRLGRPEEFAATVAFLASEPAAYITGVALPVDGGRSKHLL